MYVFYLEMEVMIKIGNFETLIASYCFAVGRKYFQDQPDGKSQDKNYNPAFIFQPQKILLIHFLFCLSSKQYISLIDS